MYWKLHPCFYEVTKVVMEITSIVGLYIVLSTTEISAAEDRSILAITPSVLSHINGKKCVQILDTYLVWRFNYLKQYFKKNVQVVATLRLTT